MNVLNVIISLRLHYFQFFAITKSTTVNVFHIIFVHRQQIQNELLMVFYKEAEKKLTILYCLLMCQVIC